MNAKKAAIPQEDLAAWLDAVAGQQTLVAPRREQDVVLYRPVTGSAEIAWEAERPLLSVKEVFFPPTEQLLTIEMAGTEVRLKETLPEGQTTVFGVRPCDARGVKLLDALFLDTRPVDPHYQRRRQQTTLIGLACKEMGPTCFCTSVGGAPDDPTGMDLMLYTTPDGYLAEAITDKGRRILEETGWPETVSGGAAQNEANRIPVPSKAEWQTHFNDEYWLRMSERCLSCRACAYVCPTCRCFAVRDEMLAPGEFERIRCWDSCAGENYRRVAGGHKPRPEKGERLRNRFYCKFFYFSEQYHLEETVACTGCGRCIDVCPVGVDIREVLTDLGRPQ
ncbi:MAG: 4Fe-4S dicluster domain-containing protein [Anaerolineales bacterium]|nr:4Fe-4S dicluster domain-containing protein [Anaerolineales bacterium]